MKGWVGYFIAILGLGIFLACNPNRDYENAVSKHRITKYQEFLNPIESPLTEEDFVNFGGLKYFPTNINYVFKAQYKPKPFPQKVVLASSKDKDRVYYHIGAINFQYKNNKYELQAFAETDTSKLLFVPFADKTTGTETYYSGRYLDLKVDSDNIILLDFNYAYNPYCAYNDKYDCPIPPTENVLPISIIAGEKMFHKP